MRKNTFNQLLISRSKLFPFAFFFPSAVCGISSLHMVPKHCPLLSSTTSSPFIGLGSTQGSSRSFSSTALRLDNAGDLTAMEVAIEVNKLKKAHQASAGPVKKEIEKEAWDCLQENLSDSNIQSAEGKAVALLLNSWAYFAKFWEKGKDGPILPEEPTETKSDPAENSEKF